MKRHETSILEQCSSDTYEAPGVSELLPRRQLRAEIHLHHNLQYVTVRNGGLSLRLTEVLFSRPPPLYVAGIQSVFALFVIT